MILSKNEIRRMIEEENLISNYIDLDTQLQPNGFDCTIKEIYKIKGYGRVDFDNSKRLLPKELKIHPNRYKWYFLRKGFYKVVLNEIVNLNNKTIAIAKPRSTLIRCGVDIITAVWDAGFKGRSEVGMVVHNPVRLMKNSRVVQMIFMKLERETEEYNGIYKYKK